MGLELIIAVLGLAIIFSYMFFKLGENTKSEHSILQLILFGLIVGCVMILGGAGFEASNCDFIPVNSTTVGATVSYGFDRVCATTPNPGSETFLKFTVWAVRLLLIYLVGYLVYKLFSALGILTNIMSKIKKKL